MSDIIEISEIDINDQPSSNFGGGLELLMNDKLGDNSSSKKSDIELNDLDNLEHELNDLVDDTHMEAQSDLFSGKVRFDDDDDASAIDIDVPIGKQTSEQGSTSGQKTWDGYAKFNDIPINPDKPLPSEPKLTAEQMLREKFKYLRKLEDLERKGIELSKKYNMESNLQEMRGEYETIIEERKKQNSVKFQGNMLMAFINGVEFLNNKFDPFDIKLDGWGEQFNENIEDYDDVFGELYEKYSSKASMAPELKLLFQLGGGAMMVHMTNTMFKSSMPGMDDILRQNPDLMKSFQSAAVNSMADTNPGFSGFMNNMMSSGIASGNSGMASGIASGMPPPPPHQTQDRPNFANDGRAFQENMNMDNDGIHMRENKSTSRPEMRGPSDISDILSGLKTRNINIQDEPEKPEIDNSTISIKDLKELQSDANMPKRSKRRQKSASNTISLDI
jgi:hypothetical protein